MCRVVAFSESPHTADDRGEGWDHGISARGVRGSLEPVRRALKSTRPPGKPQAHQKYWQELLGQAGGPVRRPMLDLTEEERAATRAAFEACGLATDPG